MGEAQGVADGTMVIETVYPDLVFLDINLNENSQLVNLSGLDNLDSISGGLYIGYCYEVGIGIPGGNASITSLHGLESLTHIGETLNIGRNPSLASLAGLENIEAGSIANIEICNDTSLSM